MMMMMMNVVALTALAALTIAFARSTVLCKSLPIVSYYTRKQYENVGLRHRRDMTLSHSVVIDNFEML